MEAVVEIFRFGNKSANRVSLSGAAHFWPVRESKYASELSSMCSNGVLLVTRKHRIITTAAADYQSQAANRETINRCGPSILNLISLLLLYESVKIMGWHPPTIHQAITVHQTK